MELPRHKLVIFIDEAGGLCPIATGCQLDGREILIPGGASITVEATDTDALRAVIPVYISEVEYRTRKRQASSPPKKQPRSWGRFWPLRKH